MKISREVGHKRGEGNDLGNLGNEYAALSDARKATEYYEQALAIFRNTGNKNGQTGFPADVGLPISN